MTAFIYMTLATAMFFWVEKEIRLGDFSLMYQFLLGAAIILWAMYSFLIHLKPERAKGLIRHSFILSVSYYVPILFSFIIWIISLEKIRTMIHGFFLVIYMFLGIGVAAATLYIFGKKGVWYCLASMVLANMLRALLIIRTAGFRPFINELKTLLLTFANETGSVIVQMEIHDQTFAFGTFLIFLLVYKNQNRYGFWWLLLTLFNFLLGLKRIAVIGAVAAVTVVFFLDFFPEKAVQKVSVFISYILIGLTFIYIVAVHKGLFGFLENELHINTMFRNTLYEVLSQYYEISITYMGKGLGFSSTDWLNLRGMPAVEIHNDFLRMYVEMGFMGYLIWIWSHFVFRMKYFFAAGGKKAGVLFLALSIYSFINYITDNTLFYYDTIIAFSITIIACCMDNSEKSQEE